MIRIIFLELLLISALPFHAAARQEAFTFATFEPTVRLQEGPAELVEVDAVREPLDDWPGFRLRVRVTNSSEHPVTLTRIDLLDHVVGNPEVSSQTLRVLTFDQRGEGRCRVFPLLNHLESHRFLAAALPGRAAAVLAGFIQDGGGLGGLAIEPDDGLLALSAWLEWDAQIVPPGESFTSPELLVFFAPDGLFGLDWLFEQMAVANDLKPAARLGPGATLEALAASQPIRINAPDLDRPPGDRVPYFSFDGEPLDLFASDGQPSVWMPADRKGELLLVNNSSEGRLSGATFGELRLKKDGLYRITTQRGSNDSRDQGVYRRGVVLPLAANTSLRLQAEPVDLAPDDASGFELLLIRVPDPDLPAELQTVSNNEPDLQLQLEETLRQGGVVIANHRGTDLLELLPPALSVILRARVFPYRPARVTVPGLDEEHLFSLRSSNLEWSLGFPAQDPGAGAWLICPEAGILATPMQAVLADGFFAGRGFALLSSRGLVLVTMNLSPAERDALTQHLLVRDQRREAVLQAARARNSVNRIPEPSGLFQELGLARQHPFDLAPTQPSTSRRFSVLIPGGPRQVRNLLIRPGQRVRDQVLHLGRRMSIGLDTAMGPSEQVVIVVRRAPDPTPTSYTIEIDSIPLGPPLIPRSEDPRFWQEDVWLLKQDLIQHRERVALGVVPASGVLPLARIGFFRYRPKAGVHLDAIELLDAQHDGRPPQENRSANGQVLRIGSEAFLQGLGCSGNTTLTYALDGPYETFLARAGIHAEDGEHGSAVLLVLVDGEERFRSEPLQGGQQPAAIAANVHGATRVVLRVIADHPDIHVDLAEARFSR